ncbi:MAG: hypothetical protein HYZ16_02285 [Bacteroidetes bacterium]|nr:hypothetical protein [Bacteroidota bacterium]
METVFLTVIIGAGAMTLAFVLIGIRMVLLKNGEFRGTCSSNNPLLAEKMGGTCSVCGGDLAKCDNAK